MPTTAVCSLSAAPAAMVWAVIAFVGLAAAQSCSWDTYLPGTYLNVSVGNGTDAPNATYVNTTLNECKALCCANRTACSSLDWNATDGACYHRNETQCTASLAASVDFEHWAHGNCSNATQEPPATPPTNSTPVPLPCSFDITLRGNYTDASPIGSFGSMTQTECERQCCLNPSCLSLSYHPDSQNCDLSGAWQCSVPLKHDINKIYVQRAACWATPQPTPLPPGATLTPLPPGSTPSSPGSTPSSPGSTVSPWTQYTPYPYTPQPNVFGGTCYYRVLQGRRMFEDVLASYVGDTYQQCINRCCSNTRCDSASYDVYTRRCSLSADTRCTASLSYDSRYRYYEDMRMCSLPVPPPSTPRPQWTPTPPIGPPTPPSSPNTSDDCDDCLATWIVVYIVIPSVVGIGFLLTSCCCCCRRKREPPAVVVPIGGANPNDGNAQPAHVQPVSVMVQEAPGAFVQPQHLPLPQYPPKCSPPASGYPVASFVQPQHPWCPGPEEVEAPVSPSGLDAGCDDPPAADPHVLIVADEPSDVEQS